MDFYELALKLHQENQGKIKVESKVPLKTKEDLSTAYTPGVAEPCREIYKDKNKLYDYTAKGNLVAVVSNGTAVLGLGNIGAEASVPVMEGKAILFKAFGGIDAFPICLPIQDTDTLVETVKYLEPVFGAINLEDIGAPQCFEVEERLKKEMDIPVFHDDQHGTAIVVLAGLINAAKVVGKELKELTVCVNGAGAAAMAVSKLLIKSGVKDLILNDSKGAIYAGRAEGMNPYKEAISRISNKEGIRGTLKDSIKGRDVFIGLSKGNMVTEEMVSSMAKDPILFAMANPTPEIMPDLAKKAGAKVVATGRSDFKNQINNVLAFPGVLRGALDARASDINEEMKEAAAYAIAELVSKEELCADYIIPNPFDERVSENVAKRVIEAAKRTKAARI